jgi:hypothetical protein
VAHAGDPAKRKTGREAIFWGLIGLVIIFGAYGIINIALGTFDLTCGDQTAKNYGASGICVYK